jgi:ADP-heptose:LPS heptosyltransferase
MKVRYRGQGIKTCTHQGEKYEISSETWTEINNLTLFKKLKSHPDVFDAVSYFDTKPFELIEDLIQFKGNLIYTGDAIAVRSLDKIPFVRKQAVKPEEQVHIYKITSYDNENMSRYADVQRTVNAFIFRKLGGIGDVLMTSPVVEAAYKRYPHFKITYSCPQEFLPLMESNPFIHYLELYHSRVTKKNWDVVSDLTRDCIKYEISHQPYVDKNRSEIFAEKCGLDINPLPRPKMFLSTDEIMLAKEELKNFKGLKVGLVLKSNAPVRNWPYFSELRDLIINSYADVCVLEFCKQKPKRWQGHEQVYPVFGRHLRDVAALINECDVVISPDTGLAHIASCLRVPTIWIFTHIDGKIRTKNYDNIWVVQTTPEDCPKGRPCWYEISCNKSEHPNLELKRDAPCSVAIEPQKVFEKLMEVLDKPNVSYVVVYKDRPNITEKCIHHIKEAKKKNDELILVDNGSKSEYAFSKEKGVICIRNKQNQGCIIGRNQGMKEASGRFVLTLDNDQFITPKTTHALMTTEGDVVGVEGWSMDEGGWAFDIKDKRGPLVYVGGGGMLVKKKVAEDVGYLSEEYAPAWFSDPDFCLKATKRGYSIECQHGSGITHLKHKTINIQDDFDSEAAWRRSHKIFVKKWGSYLSEENGLITPKDISTLITSKTPVVLFYMLSWLRHDYLITTLESLTQTLRMPVFFNLRVQGAERIDSGLRAE